MDLRFWSRIVARTVCLIALVGAAWIGRPPAPAVAAVAITVTTTADELNQNGHCSLREAIANANADDQSGSSDCVAGAGGDTILFAVAGTISLTAVLPEISDAAGLTIVGPAGGIAISGSHAFRPFVIRAGALAALQRLTVTGGLGDLGGAIDNRGRLTVIDSLFTDNEATRGGAIYNAGTLTLGSTTFSENRAAFGGAIRSSGEITIVDCAFLGNTATDRGGAINSLGTMTISRSAFSANQATHAGGGIVNNGSLIVTSTTFAGNAAEQGGGIITIVPGASVVDGCTFVGNSASVEGGGINNYSGTQAVVNSTFSGNSAPVGGAIHNNAPLTVTNSTLVDNTAMIGGAIRNGDGGSATLLNTIVAGSAGGENCAGALVDGGNNLDSGMSCGWDAGRGSLSGVDALLGPLAANGGRTQTHALLAGSPAIDAVTWNAPNGCPATDQRGFSRPRGARCDIGAYEGGGYMVYLALMRRSGG